MSNLTRRCFLMLCAVLCVAPLFAAAPSALNGYELKVATDRADHLYARSDTVTFTVTLLHRGQPVAAEAAKWSITKDGVPMNLQGTSAVPASGLVLTAKLDEPGFLHCLVECTPPDTKKLTARGGAGIEPLAIQRSQPAPADFDAFWAEQKRALAAVPANLKLTPVKSPVEGVECFDVQADTGAGRGMSGYLARPISAKPGTLPAIVLGHGAGVTGARLAVVARWAKDGFVALDFNANGLPNEQPREFYAGLQNGELKQYYLQGLQTRETAYLRTVFLRLLRAMETVTTQPEWDGKHFVALGRSQGGALALAAGGLDPRVTYVSAEIPALCDHTGHTVGRISGWPHLVPPDGKVADQRIVDAARYYDSMNFAARIKGEVFVTVGFIDHICPPTGVYAAYNQISTKKAIWPHLDTGHVSRADYEARVRDEVLRYLKESSATAK